MIQLLPVEDKLFKWDDVTGQAWMFYDDDNGNPVWLEIKDKAEEKDNA